MPIEPSDFVPVRYLRNPHVQTLAGALWPVGRMPEYRRERLELADSDFIDLDWIDRGSSHCVIICHGLEGSSKARYMRRMARLLAHSGWSVVAWNYRGCSGLPNRLLRAYHSGDTPDLHTVVSHAATRHRSLALVGFSLGGNLVLKYAGESSLPPAVKCLCAVSAPVDLASSVAALEGRRLSRPYLRRMVRSLRGKITGKATAFGDQIDLTDIHKVRDFSVFDERFTAPLHGFCNAREYWQKCSARFVLANITIPSLLINACDDPFLGDGCFPRAEAAASSRFFFASPAHGGHLGFIQSAGSVHSWAETRVQAFLSEYIDQ